MFDTIRLRAAAAAAFLLSPLAPAAMAQEQTTQPAPAATPEAGQAAADPVLATVNGRELRRSDVEASAQALPEQYRSQMEQLMPALVDRLVDLTILSQAGRAENLQEDPEVKAIMSRVEDEAIRQVAVRRLLKERLTDERVKQRYDELVKTMPAQQEAHARHILVDSKEKAEEIIKKLEGGADFATLAKESSIDPAKENGGDLGWFTQDQMVPEFSQAAFALEKGKYTTAPVQSQFGWHVILLEDKRDRPAPTLEEVRPQIASELSQQIIGERISELKKSAEVKLFNPDGTPRTEAPVTDMPGTAPAGGDQSGAATEGSGTTTEGTGTTTTTTP